MKNAVYVNGLLENLTQVLDKYIINGSKATVRGLDSAIVAAKEQSPA